MTTHAKLKWNSITNKAGQQILSRAMMLTLLWCCFASRQDFHYYGDELPPNSCNNIIVPRAEFLITELYGSAATVRDSLRASFSLNFIYRHSASRRETSAWAINFLFYNEDSINLLGKYLPSHVLCPPRLPVSLAQGFIPYIQHRVLLPCA